MIFCLFFQLTFECLQEFAGKSECFLLVTFKYYVLIELERVTYYLKVPHMDISLFIYSTSAEGFTLCTETNTVLLVYRVIGKEIEDKER